MVIALLALQSVSVNSAKQPQTIDVVGYQSVQHALSNGAPDPSAPDNYYIKVQSHYKLLADSNEVAPDERGSRLARVPAVNYDSHETYSESGKASKALDAMFTEIHRPWDRDAFKTRVTGRCTSPDQNHVIAKGSRLLAYERFTIVERKETHVHGKQHITRTITADGWGALTTIEPESSGIFDPSTNQVVGYGSKPEVRVDPPVYEYRWSP